MKPIFQKGDVISSIDKSDIRLIIGVKKDEYKYINLTEKKLKDIFGNVHIIKKGSTSTQSVDTIHKHFSLLDLSVE